MIDFNEIFAKCRYHLKLQDSTILYNTAKNINAKTILEIGGGVDGTSTIILAHIAKENDGMLYSIEPKIGGSWEDTAKYFGVRNYITRIQENSPTNMVNIPLDYLFIDGDHSTIGVLADYSYYKKLVRTGGIIAFHDYNDAEAGIQVRKAIDIILQSDKLTFVDKWNGDFSCGIIVYRKD